MKKNRLNSSIQTADCYHNIALSNEHSADILLKSNIYNEASYMYIQAMEKFVKEQICRRVDVTNQYFAKRIRDTGHQLDKSIEFLVEICSGNNVALKEQLKTQLIHNVMGDMRFSAIHNNLRYPQYSEKFKNYTMIEFSQKDCIHLRDMTNKLIKFMNDLYRIV